MVIWTNFEKPLGCGYTVGQNATAYAGEMVAFGYAAVPDTGTTLTVPDTASVYIAENITDTDGVTVAGTVTSDSNGYVVTANLTSTQSAALCGTYEYRNIEGRSGEKSYPFGGCITFGDLTGVSDT
jgi:hypothetical protein